MSIPSSPRVSVPPVSSKEAVYDVSEWPIFLVTSPRAVLTLSETRDHMRRVTEIGFCRREPFVLIFDARGAPRPDALQRKATADEMQESGKHYPGLCLGVGVVILSAWERGIVKAITWLASPPYPTDAFDGVPAAKVWARKLLRMHGDARPR